MPINATFQSKSPVHTHVAGAAGNVWMLCNLASHELIDLLG